ncbi:MAG: hypothetical protein ACTHMM_05860 [Agriterribacter sp.]
MTIHPTSRRINGSLPFALFFVVLLVCGSGSLYARGTAPYPSVHISQDTSAEEKIDYIERIYFSRKNKDDLNVMILTTLQDLEGAQATTSVAKQYAFLSGIKEKADASETACDILEILAAGAYALDAKKAAAQQVLLPNDAAKAKAGDALQSLSNTFGSVNSSLGNAAYNSYVLSRGKVNIFGASNTVYTIAGTANTITGSLSEGKKLYNEGKKIWKQLGGGNGPCKKVPYKDIAIGRHEVPQQGAQQNTSQQQQKTGQNSNNSAESITTIISIPGITSGALRSLTDAMETRPGVQTATRSYNETLSTITITHSGSTDDLADWLEDKFGKQYKLVGFSVGKINMAPKGK